MKHLTDQELMKIVQAGDHSPASELYDRYSKRIYNFAWQILRNAELAEDTTQEVFLKMIRHAHTFKENASLPAWLYTVTKNCCRDYFRRGLNRAPMETDDVLASMPAPIEDDPGHRLEQSTNARAVLDALAQITEDQREAIILARYHGMSHAEIALVVGCSAGAVKTRIFRGIEAMRNILMPQPQPQTPADEATPAEETPVEETNV